MADKLISFSELVKAFDDCCGECGCCIHHLPDHSERNTHCLILNSLKAVDAVPVVHGRWVHEQRYGDSGGWVWHCSACRREAISPIISALKYCHSCGAIMDAKEEEHGQES